MNLKPQFLVKTKSSSVQEDGKECSVSTDSDISNVTCMDSVLFTMQLEAQCQPVAGSAAGAELTHSRFLLSGPCPSECFCYPILA